MQSVGRIEIGCGPREVEALLLAELVRLAEAAREDPGLLAQPVRVVVPSQSLAKHAARALLRHTGHGVAGVRFQTLHGLALEVLDATGVPAPRGDDLFGVFVRRAARQEAPLRDVLEGLEDGYAAVIGAATDLLDAGYEADVPAHRDAVDSALEDSGLPAPTRLRVGALARVAGAAAAAMKEHGLGRRSTRLALARDALAADPSLLPTRALIVHGFADATGCVSDLLEVVMRLDGACLLLDQPADPARSERRDLGVAFTRRLLARIAPNHSPPAAEPEAPGTAVAALRASGTEAEVRAVADRIHALLEAGTEPESVAIVARDLPRYVVALRTQLSRLGIPFSSESAVGPPSGRSRRVHGLLDLLAERAQTPADRWLETLAALGRGQRADLRLAFHAVGAGRLADVAALDADRLLGTKRSLPLPARLGLEEGDGDRSPHARRRSVSAARLRETLDRARALRDHLMAWPRSALLSEHHAALRTLVGEHFGWRDSEERAALDRVGVVLESELPDLELEFDEFVLLLKRLLRAAGSAPLGGAGAGVQVLGVVEARARSFEHLFLLGVNRNGFPRPFTEDPLFPDSVRQPLEVVLPEIPVKARGFEEEHYLFAQLLAASPSVTLSWQVADDEGKARSPSPFVDRLRGAGVLSEVEEAPTLQAPPERSVGRPRTASEAAITEALYGDARRFAELVPLVVEERSRFGSERKPAEPLAAGSNAAARIAVLRELAAGPGGRRVGPYYGFLGPARLEQDLRRRPLFVTHLEGMARCPWQFFLKRLLGVEPAPNALDALPEATGLLLGNLVHGVLERIVVASRPEDGVPAAGYEVPWPEARQLGALLAEEAAALLVAEGIGPPAFAGVLVRAALPLLVMARGLEWPAPGSDVRCLGAEREGALEVVGPGGGSRTIRFRADRVDSVAGSERYIDYKTGRRTPSTKTKVREGLLKAVATGTHLQAAAYAFTSGGEGRYLFLSPDAAAAVYPVAGDDAEFRRAFDAAVATVLGAFDDGAFLPRLSDAEGTGPHKHCEWCEVHEACLQGDAGARGRLVDWVENGNAASRAESSALELWHLPERTPE